MAFIFPKILPDTCKLCANWVFEAVLTAYGEAQCCISSTYMHMNIFTYSKRNTTSVFVSAHKLGFVQGSYGNMSPGLAVSILPNDTRLPLHVEGGDPT